MTYGGAYPASWERDWTPDWREYQYQIYQESLREEEDETGE